jgi:hypothetical protein
MRRFVGLMALGVSLTASGTIGMAMGTTSSPPTEARADGHGETGYLEVSRLVDMAIDQLLVSTDDTNPLSEQREAVLQAQL